MPSMERQDQLSVKCNERYLVLGVVSKVSGEIQFCDVIVLRKSLRRENFIVNMRESLLEVM